MIDEPANEYFFPLFFAQIIFYDRARNHQYIVVSVQNFLTPENYNFLAAVSFFLCEESLQA